MALRAEDFRAYRERLLVEMLNLSRTGLTELHLRTALGECDWLITRCREAIPAPEYARFKSQQKAWLRADARDAAKTAAACRLVLKGFLDAIESKAMQVAQAPGIPVPGVPTNPASLGRAAAKDARSRRPLRKRGAEPDDETWRSHLALLHAKVGDLEREVEALSRTLQDREDQLNGKRGELAAVAQELARVKEENIGLAGQIMRLNAEIAAQDKARREAGQNKAGPQPVQAPPPQSAHAAKPTHRALEERLTTLERNIAELHRRRAAAV